MDNRSSADIRRELRGMGDALPEPDDESELGPSSPSLYDEGIEEIPPEIQVGEGEELEEETIEAEEDNPYRDPIYESLMAKKRKGEREYIARKEKYFNEFDQGYTQPQETYQEPVQPNIQQQAWQQNLAVEFEKDCSELKDRYGGIVDDFYKDAKFGRLKMPRGLEDKENAHEVWFWDWVGRRDNMAKLSGKELENILRKASSLPPLQCRTLDMLMPERKKPAPKPKATRPKTRIQDLSTDDMREALTDFYAKHPEKR